MSEQINLKIWKHSKLISEVQNSNKYMEYVVISSVLL